MCPKSIVNHELIRQLSLEVYRIASSFGLGGMVKRVAPVQAEAEVFANAESEAGSGAFQSISILLASLRSQVVACTTVKEAEKPELAFGDLHQRGDVGRVEFQAAAESGIPGFFTFFIPPENR